MTRQTGKEPAAEGTVTIGGESPAVEGAGERRGLDIYAPGGYCWLPAAGDRVLTLGGDGRAVLGMPTGAAPDGMQPGEVYIKSDSGASLWLRRDGSIQLSGRVSISGSLELNGQQLGV